ncbi:legume-like lectin family-domain-containing protein [Chytriomyces sp. MP71]|nr:legume-like lectin family-domain-containing protein [Chytriomyces sp. MP71]
MQVVWILALLATFVLARAPNDWERKAQYGYVHPARAVPGFDPEAETVPLRTRFEYRQSFKTPYFFHSGTAKYIPYFEVRGSYVLLYRAAASNDSIRLASSVPMQQGSIWAQSPNPHAEWQVRLQFKSSGRGHIGGDGLAFWYTMNQGRAGPVFGSEDAWTGFGLLFDSSDMSKNRFTPQIFGSINDGSKFYAQEPFSVGNCYRPYRNALHPATLRITYSGNKLKVEIDLLGEGRHYSECFSADNINLPSGYYFGFSAGNEEKFADDHDVLGLEVSQVNPPKVDRGTVPEIDLNSEQFRKIAEADQIAEAARHENEPPEYDTEADDQSLIDIKDSQMRIIEMLDAIERRLPSGSVSNGVAASGPSLQDTRNLIQPLESKIEEMKRGLSELQAQLERLDNSVRGIYTALDRNANQGNAKLEHISKSLGNSQDKIDKTHEAVTTNASKPHYFAYSMFLVIGALLMYAGSIVFRVLSKKNEQKRYL